MNYDVCNVSCTHVCARISRKYSYAVCYKTYVLTICTINIIPSTHVFIFICPHDSRYLTTGETVTSWNLGHKYARGTLYTQSKKKNSTSSDNFYSQLARGGKNVGTSIWYNILISFMWYPHARVCYNNNMQI